MSFTDGKSYAARFNKEIDEHLFNRAAELAARELECACGSDGAPPLPCRAPEGTPAREALAACELELIDAIVSMWDATATAAAARGRVEDENGMHGGVIASVSAGNEFVSYKSSAALESVVERAAADVNVRAAWVASLIRAHLSGVRDKNGVPLLYGGRYERAVRKE